MECVTPFTKLPGRLTDKCLASASAVPGFRSFFPAANQNTSRPGVFSERGTHPSTCLIHKQSRFFVSESPMEEYFSLQSIYYGTTTLEAWQDLECLMHVQYANGRADDPLVPPNFPVIICMNAAAETSRYCAERPTLPFRMATSN